MATTKHIKTLFTWAALALFVTYYASVALSWHCHVINGVTIIHSHFHSSDHCNAPDGRHSASEITLIAHLNAQQFIEQNILSYDLCIILPVLHTEFATQTIEILRQTNVCSFSLRAPPEIMI